MQGTASVKVYKEIAHDAANRIKGLQILESSKKQHFAIFIQGDCKINIYYFYMNL